MATEATNVNELCTVQISTSALCLVNISGTFTTKPEMQKSFLP